MSNFIALPKSKPPSVHDSISDLRKHYPVGTLFYSRLHKQYYRLHSPKHQKHLTLGNSLHPVNMKPEHKTWVLLME